VRSIFRQSLKEAGPSVNIDSLIIHPGDFASVVESLLPGLTTEQVQQLISSFDVNTDGELTVGEFISVVEQLGTSKDDLDKVFGGPGGSSKNGGTTPASSRLGSIPGDRQISLPSESTVLGSDWEVASTVSSTATAVAEGIAKLEYGGKSANNGLVIHVL